MHEPDNQELAGRIDRIVRDLRALTNLAHETHDEQAIMRGALSDFKSRIAVLETTLVGSTTTGDTMQAYGVVVNPPTAEITAAVHAVEITDALHVVDNVVTSTGGTAVPRP